MPTLEQNIGTFTKALGGSLLAGSGPSGRAAFTSLTNQGSALKQRQEELDLVRRDKLNKQALDQAKLKFELNKGILETDFSNEPNQEAISKIQNAARIGIVQSLGTMGIDQNQAMQAAQSFRPPVPATRSVTSVNAQGVETIQNVPVTDLTPRLAKPELPANAQERVAFIPDGQGGTREVPAIFNPRQRTFQVSLDGGASFTTPPSGAKFRSVSVAAKTPEESGITGVTDAAVSKAITETAEARTTTQNLNKGLNQVIDFVKSDDYVGGLSGEGIRLLNSGMQQAVQVLGREDPLLKNGVFNLDVADVTNLSAENISFLRRSAILGDVKDGAVARLSFILAKQLNPDGRISDADVKNARKMIDGSADKASTILQLQNMIDISTAEFDTRAKNVSDAIGLGGDPRFRTLGADAAQEKQAAEDKGTAAILKNFNITQ